MRLINNKPPEENNLASELLKNGAECLTWASRMLNEILTKTKEWR